LKRPTIFATLLQIGLAYIKLIKRIGSLLLFIAAVGVTGFAISYPLWMFASQNQRGYSLTALLILAGGLAGFLILRGRRLRGHSGGSHLSSKKRVARGFMFAGSALALLAAVYFLIFLFSLNMYGLGIPLLILFFFFLGLFIYGISKPKA
jgi:hypothetical protein